jgi:hypothetical protein
MVEGLVSGTGLLNSLLAGRFEKFVNPFEACPHQQNILMTYIVIADMGWALL